MSGVSRVSCPAPRAGSSASSWAKSSTFLLLAVIFGTTIVLGDFARGQVPESEPRGIEASVAESSGRELYGRCLACHAIDYDRVGPRHCGLFGRRAGTVSGFGYSEAMRNSGIVWGSESLDRFLGDPMGTVPGTLMTYAGISDQRERALLIAWLKSSTSPERCRPADS